MHYPVLIILIPLLYIASIFAAESLPRNATVGVPEAVIDISVFGRGTGPIFLNELDCNRMERDLLTCAQRNSDFGMTTCTHAMDVGVRCPGKGFLL